MISVAVRLSEKNNDYIMNIYSMGTSTAAE